MEARQDQRFPKHSRLTTRRDFTLVKKQGQRRSSAHLVLFSRHNGSSLARLGLAVSRKVGKAHDRNLLKRRLRELFRRSMVAFTPGRDYLVIAKVGAAEVDFLGLGQELSHMLLPPTTAARTATGHTR